MLVSAPDAELDEQTRVLRNRYAEALKAGLTAEEAWKYSESDRDIGELRQLVAGECPIETLRRIVL